MSECKHQCIVLKRICNFILALEIGFLGGYKYGFAERTERMHDRLMKQAEKPVFKRQRNKAPEPRGETFFEKKKRVPR